MKKKKKKIKKGKEQDVSEKSEEYNKIIKKNYDRFWPKRM